jgi:hypothetical protein
VTGDYPGEYAVSFNDQAAAGKKEWLNPREELRAEPVKSDTERGYSG